MLTALSGFRNDFKFIIIKIKGERKELLNPNPIFLEKTNDNR